MVVKLDKSNYGLDHLSRINLGKDMQSIEDAIPDAQFFRLNCVPFDL